MAPIDALDTQSARDEVAAEPPKKVARTMKTFSEPPTYAGKPTTKVVDEAREAELQADGRIFEYTSAANPSMPEEPVLGLDASLHQSGPTKVHALDLKEKILTPFSATSPNLLVSFIRICKGENIPTAARATSQAFYIISGEGSSSCEEHGEIHWATGDMVVLPAVDGQITHSASPDSDCAIYWVSDEPLLKYLGVKPCEDTFKPTVIRRTQMVSEVEKICHEDGVEHRNRMGVLLGNKVTDYREKSEGASGTLTLTPTLWSLLNLLPEQSAQKPHRHNSVALDLCVYSAAKGVYTLMGPELNEDGSVKDPIRCDWSSGSMFVTPPGWWHSHHNETDEPAWVLPMQDAGLLTYQRVLDIQFAK